MFKSTRRNETDDYQAGVDLIRTTLSGYIKVNKKQNVPDMKLIKQLVGTRTFMQKLAVRKVE
ncbi:hypothetical protein NSA26_12385 [Enterococcus hirae]|nr:hypothetical protein [Enterococcus hirae]MCR1913370.1 hypothetical protein [Enterococcus hirae]